MTGLGFMMTASTVLACGIMVGLWLIQRRTGNAGIVDIGWSGSIPLLVALCGILLWTDQTRTSADVMRQVAATMMCALWGFRLVAHIHRRSHGKPEDRRYATLRKNWGNHAQRNLFWFFQFQAVAAALFALPYILILRNPAPDIHPLEWAGLVLWFMAWFGEAIADQQLAAFKRNPANEGKVCDAGLWNYSRHPNYFFEWLIWCAVALAALPAPLGWIALVCPVLMLFFLFKVTGIPATEAQALKSKGDAYRRYQKTTSVFVPWFKRKD
ncbi:MAG TPA: DUF1295 domain-containing protein [Kiritimatiellia bacterium]|nr:DUF1295 domain-containing protein [Kiritimatiellia bacterium]HMO97892.1 DUF1295 domain-containing protein [Kiritimatiellia bacterium]HMP95588.1 DUF1295 domain-containing protein [Kiritimatiellia bacterium]